MNIPISATNTDRRLRCRIPAFGWACGPWCCEDEATDACRDLLRRAGGRETLHVPSIWPWELMNSVAMAVPRQRITAVRAAEFLEQLTAFRFSDRIYPKKRQLTRREFANSLIVKWLCRRQLSPKR